MEEKVWSQVEEYSETIIGHHIEKVLYARLLDVVDLIVPDSEQTKLLAAKRIVKTSLKSLTEDMRHIASAYAKGAVDKLEATETK